MRRNRDSWSYQRNKQAKEEKKKKKKKKKKYRNKTKKAREVFNSERSKKGSVPFEEGFDGSHKYVKETYHYTKCQECKKTIKILKERDCRNEPKKNHFCEECRKNDHVPSPPPPPPPLPPISISSRNSNHPSTEQEVKFHNFKKQKKGKNRRGKIREAEIMIFQNLPKLAEDTNATLKNPDEILYYFRQGQKGRKTMEYNQQPRNNPVGKVDGLDRDLALRSVNISSRKNHKMYQFSGTNNRKFIYDGDPRHNSDVRNPNVNKFIAEFLGLEEIQFIDPVTKEKKIFAIITNIDNALSLIKSGYFKDIDKLVLNDYIDGIAKDLKKRFAGGLAWQVHPDRNDPNSLLKLLVFGFGSLTEDNLKYISTIPRIKKILKKSLIRYGTTFYYLDKYERRIIQLRRNRIADLGWLRKILITSNAKRDGLTFQVIKMIFFRDSVINGRIQDLHRLMLNRGVVTILRDNDGRIIGKNLSKLNVLIEFLGRTKKINLEFSRTTPPLDGIPRPNELLNKLGFRKEDFNLGKLFVHACSIVPEENEIFCLGMYMTSFLLYFFKRYPNHFVWNWNRCDNLDMHCVGGIVTEYRSPELCHFTPSTGAPILNSLVAGHKGRGDYLINFFKTNRLKNNLVRVLGDYTSIHLTKLRNEGVGRNGIPMSWKTRYSDDAAWIINRFGEKNTIFVIKTAAVKVPLECDGVGNVVRFEWRGWYLEMCKIFPEDTSPENRMKMIGVFTTWIKHQKFLRSPPGFWKYIVENDMKGLEKMNDTLIVDSPSEYTHYVALTKRFVKVFQETGLVPLEYSGGVFEGGNCLRKMEYYHLNSNGNFGSAFGLCLLYSWIKHIKLFHPKFNSDLRNYVDKKEKEYKEELRNRRSAFSSPFNLYHRDFGKGIWAKSHKSVLLLASCRDRGYFTKFIEREYSIRMGNANVTYPFFGDLIDVFNPSMFVDHIIRKLKTEKNRDEMDGFFMVNLSEESLQFYASDILAYTKRFCKKIEPKLCLHIDLKIIGCNDKEEFRKSVVYRDLLKIFKERQIDSRSTVKTKKREFPSESWGNIYNDSDVTDEERIKFDEKYRKEWIDNFGEFQLLETGVGDFVEEEEEEEEESHRRVEVEERVEIEEVEEREEVVVVEDEDEESYEEEEILEDLLTENVIETPRVIETRSRKRRRGSIDEALTHHEEPHELEPPNKKLKQDNDVNKVVEGDEVEGEGDE